MITNLEEALALMKLQKDDFTEIINSLPESVKSKPTNPERWNVSQVLEHVIVSERGTLGYLIKKTSSGWEDLPIGTEENAHESIKLHDALVSDKKWAAPSILPEPLGERSFEDQFAFWDGIRAKYEEFLGALDPNFYDREVFRHPFAGRLTLWQTLDFLTNHIVHHKYQINRMTF